MASSIVATVQPDGSADVGVNGATSGVDGVPPTQTTSSRVHLVRALSQTDPVFASAPAQRLIRIPPLQILASKSL